MIDAVGTHYETGQPITKKDQILKHPCKQNYPWERYYRLK